MLERVEGRLCLRARHRPEFGAICPDWDDAQMRSRIAAGRRQLLARAVGLHKQHDLRVLDATAGLGRDGFVLAALGARVTMAERQCLLVQLLQDAHARTGERAPDCAARIEIVQQDSLDLMRAGRVWDTVYLDPMFPDSGKSALPQKEMQLFRELTLADDGALLLPAARAAARTRVVVKRPLKAPTLAGVAPAFSLKGTQTRFDVYLPA